MGDLFRDRFGTLGGAIEKELFGFAAERIEGAVVVVVVVVGGGGGEWECRVKRLWGSIGWVVVLLVGDGGVVDWFVVDVEMVVGTVIATELMGECCLAYGLKKKKLKY